MSGIKQNVFILHGVLPSTAIENWKLHQLCYLHDHQLMSKADQSYINHIRELIREQAKWLDDYTFSIAFHGDGCCSEYRNSVNFQVKRLNEILNT